MGIKNLRIQTLTYKGFDNMYDNKITKAILHDFLVECYIAYKSDIKDKGENKLESIPKRSNSWNLNLVRSL